MFKPLMPQLCGRCRKPGIPAIFHGQGAFVCRACLSRPPAQLAARDPVKQRQAAEAPRSETGTLLMWIGLGGQP